MIKIHEIKLITKLALPLMAAFLAQKSMQVTDTVMMGWLGPYALAAGALGTVIFMTSLLFCMGTLSAIGIFIARARGANQTDDVKSYLHNGVCLALFLSLPCMSLIWLAPYMLPMLGEDALIVKNTTLLLHGLVWGVPGYLLYLVFREFISAFALARMVMVVTFCSIPLTFIVNYVLIYGKVGLPPLGVAGIGYAGAGVMWFMFLALLFYAKKNILLKDHIGSLQVFKFDLQKIIALFHVGVPSGAILVLDVGMFLLAAIMIGHFGVAALAAHQVAMQCATLGFAIPFALSMATALQVGHAAAANDFVQAKRFTYLGIGMGLTVSAAMATLFIFAPQFLLKFFLKPTANHYQEIMQLAVSFLVLGAIFQCFDALQTILNGALRGLKDTLIPMLLFVGCYWGLGVSSAYYFAFHTQLGVIGVWYGLTIGLCSAGIMLALRYYSVISKLQQS